MKRIFLSLIIALLFCFSSSMSANGVVKKVLIVTEGSYDLKSPAIAEARQLYNLLGHFNTAVTIEASKQYAANDIKKFDIIFYVGYHDGAQPSPVFENDILKTDKTVIWLNSGLSSLEKREDFKKKYGFEVNQIDKSKSFNSVKSGVKNFTRDMNEIYTVQVYDKKAVNILATAHSDKLHKDIPYIVLSNKFYYVADIPFLNATETDRYLLFSDMLHEMVGENHPENHHAIVRIEDITPLDNPNKLHDIADILSERNIPFMVGVVPFYVNPQEGRRVALSERPEMVDALKYCVENGGTIVMHGVTHQYRGVTADDFEFWDGGNNKPIEDENSEDISAKIESGINEFFKNGIYPMVWETPHYTASILSYQNIVKYFSTSVEQRLVTENFDFGQYFPYEINRDIYGQKIYPEYLGYVPLSPKKDTSELYAKKIIEASKSSRYVRDGYASFFFHSFLDLDLLKEIVDGISKEGYTFYDMRQSKNWVKMKDKVILTGSQSYNITLANSYLYEIYYNKKGEIKRKIISDNRINGIVSKSIVLEPDEFYIAEPLEYRTQELTFTEKAMHMMKGFYQDFVQPETDWKGAKVAACWNEFSRGAGYKDQSSFVSMFNSVNINVDTIFINKKISVENKNILVVPYAYADSLTNYQIQRILQFVKKGGCLITDRRSKLTTALNIRFLDTEMKVHAVRDKLFPQEHITWAENQLIRKFETSEQDEAYCVDAATGLPIVIGRKFEKGKILFFGTAFDANSMYGYSNFPYALEYVKDYFDIKPVVKKNNLEFYFDPGLRKTTSIESSIKQWVKEGIRIVHVGAWHEYPKWKYDYARLIKLAHENGILVIAWIEAPQVSLKFYQNHPEWHEKNYKNEDVSSGWRNPVALEDEKCLQASIDEYLKLLKGFDWDGVNLAELYFDSDKGFENPAKFHPMHPAACAEVMSKYKINLKKIFDTNSPFYWKTNAHVRECVTKYRSEKIYELHDKILTAIYGFAKSKPGFQIMVTSMDSYGSPELKEEIGVDCDHIIELQKKYGFLLQVEDPANKWSTEPNRYKKIGELYAQKLGGTDKLLLDLNILQFRNKDIVTPFPTLVPTGIESYQLINSSALGAPRYTIYSEATVNPQDIPMFSFASASQVEYGQTDAGYDVDSPTSFTIQLPKKYKIVLVDDQHIIGNRDNEFLIPAGAHTILYDDDKLPGFSTVEIQPQIMSFTGNLLKIKYEMRSVIFTYVSQGRGIVSLSQAPSKIKIDGKLVDTEVMQGRDCYSFFVPDGKHDVVVTTGNSLSYGVNVTSLWSSNAIVIYGALSVIMMVFMYIIMKIVRRRYEKK